VQFSDKILNENIAPELSKLSKCGAPKLPAYPNYFSEFMLRSSLGKSKFKAPVHALLVVFYRRIDFACLEYRNGRKLLGQYCKNLPSSNSKTRLFRMALAHFETCMVHANAAIICLLAINKGLQQQVQHQPGDEYDRLNKITNRIRHYDEDVFAKGKFRKQFHISPVWLTNKEIVTRQCALTFKELQKLLIAAMVDSKTFAEMLR
jgi:hypothetical protein